MKIFKLGFLLLLTILLCWAIYYAWNTFPIISGYGAKMLCSCSMLAGRTPEDIMKNELGRFPLSLGSFKTNYEDSSATGTVLGLAHRKAIYRKRLGCTLINETEENAVRNQPYYIPPPPALNTDTIPWPMGDLLPATLLTDVTYSTLQEVVEETFHEPGPERLRKTRALIIVYDGNIIAEKYAEGFDKNSLLIGWSMTKSLTNALTAILVKHNQLNIDERAPLDKWKSDDRKKITLNDLLHASSGLEWTEDYSNPSPANKMLFTKKDMGLYAAEFPTALPPGKKFKYSSGTSNIIARIIRETIGDDMYYRFPYEQLFYKIGVHSMVLEPDAGGTFVGSSYSFATARDWARFGLLYLNDGVSNHERILPEGWVSYTRTPASSTERGEYGAQFWLNAGEHGNPKNRYYPDVPTDLFWADGYEGQNVFIIPSKKLVVVKLSQSQGNYIDDNEFLASIIEALPRN